MSTTFYMCPISLVIQYLNNIGVLAAGGQLNTYVGGSVSTPVTTYTDSTGANANPNPMTLNAAGRPASTSGAPTAFWVPGGTLVKLVVFDSVGNLLASIDNVPGLNDLTNTTSSLQSALANPASSNSADVGPVAGVDLVANAVKSYDVFADVRAANVPSLATGQTLNIEVQGGLTINDQLGGFFYWNASSTASDDGLTVLNPIANTGSGRWLRWYSQNLDRSVVKTTDQSVSSSTSLTADTQLAFTSVPAGTYLVKLRAKLLSPSGTSQGYQVSVNCTSSPSGPSCGGGVTSSNGTAAAAVSVLGTPVTGSALSATNGDVVNLDFAVTTSSAGAFTVSFCQNTSSSNATVMKAGSTLILQRLD